MELWGMWILCFYKQAAPLQPCGWTALIPLALNVLSGSFRWKMMILDETTDLSCNKVTDKNNPSN